jgi:hypothetical protein
MLKLILPALLILGTASAEARVLKCWNKYSRSRIPLITAKIKSNSKLAMVTVNNPTPGDDGDDGQGEFEDNLQANGETVQATLITSRRSPYVGNNEFQLTDFRLILPTSLSDANLITKLNTGIGMGPGENGVAIGSFDNGGDGAGSHISVRLRCRNYAK